MCNLAWTTKSVCIDLFEHIGLKSNKAIKNKNLKAFFGSLAHTNQNIPLNLYWAKIWCILLQQQSVHQCCWKYRPKTYSSKKRTLRYFSEKQAHTYENIPSNVYWAKLWCILLENKVNMHGLVLLVQLSWREASPLMVYPWPVVLALASEVNNTQCESSNLFALIMTLQRRKLFRWWHRWWHQKVAQLRWWHEWWH